MSELTKKKHLRPYHQMFDEVRITTNPRFKDSELSGSEWRISATIDFLCKGKIFHSATFHDVEKCLDFAKSEYWKGSEKGRCDIPYENQFCDQEGCTDSGTYFYKVERQYNSDGDIARHQFDQVRSFCIRHRLRGDQSLNDNDLNYITV